MPNPSISKHRGFALVVTLSLMILLTLIAVGLLSLSAVSLRSGAQANAQAEAQANARLALVIALGELQKEMGPDMRISAESALLDTDSSTEKMDGVARSHWLASYNAWGDWLNNSYSSADAGVSSVRIADTYTKGREKMFRRWLLSLPAGAEKNLQLPVSPVDSADKDWVSLVDTGTLGASAANNADRITRAYKTTLGKSGKFAWWIGPENHKAKINLIGKPRTLAASQWQDSQGNTAEVGIGALNGYSAFYNPSDAGDKLLTANTLRPAQIEKDRVEERFFDLTAASKGVLTSVRTGQLKKDLSLLFEMDSSKLPAPYKFNTASDIVEPSIRPMSLEIAKRAWLQNRHFQSWTNMRHYYRMYRSASDATVGGTGGPGVLSWNSGKPRTDVVATADLSKTNLWTGSNNYWRVPILAKITWIYSLLTEQVAAQPGRYKCYHVYSPVFTYWNPYNTELRIPDGTITMASSAYRVWPNTGELYIKDALVKNSSDLGAFGTFGYSQGINAMSALRSGNGGEIVFKPGELRVFSYKSNVSTGSQATSGNEAPLYPGFDPMAISGEKKDYGPYSPKGAKDGTFGMDDRPGVKIMFTHGLWGGNINRGNTAGSLCWQDWWDRPNHANGMPMTYANDWLDKSQTMTPMTPPGVSNIAYWVFDNRPLPVAFCQLVIKGLSEFNYESIASRNPAPHNWAQDWRSRNWIQSPPFYFGHGMYCSEDKTIAHTQRLDNPYVVFFGPTSMGELPKVVGQIGQNSFLGSGSNPFEKVTSVAALELPTAPPGSLASFAGMRINPGWTHPDKIGIDKNNRQVFYSGGYGGSGWTSTGEESLYCAETKRVAYQSGVTGPGIGNSFIHPMIPRDDVYRFIDNSKSQDTPDRQETAWMNTIEHDTKAYCDYWDHAFLLNDALWDDYFLSSLADQTRPSASGTAMTLAKNIDQLVSGKEISNSRYRYYSGGKTNDAVKSELQASDGYLKAAKYLMVDGMFNVNSTSVAAWQALFTGIRERQLVYRDSSGSAKTISIPTGKRIAISRFDTEIGDQETTDPGAGSKLPDGSNGWTGVRYLDDDQLLKLAEECVKQVKQRGPFLNFSEFINRRLSTDKLGLMGALQSAIDYDDGSPDAKSINYNFKKVPGYMMTKSNLGVSATDSNVAKRFSTPEAVEGSRLAGIPGYVIQSDLLKPIANTLSVRDDTFRIRAYGEALDARGNVIARAWCEAVVQRMPEYSDPANDPSVPARLVSTTGTFSDNAALTAGNRIFGRKFQIESFRWLDKNEI